MKLKEACDLVDIYGADPKRWPDHRKAALNDMMATSAKFRKYVEKEAELDKMLNNWDEGDDGVKVQDDDKDAEEDERPDAPPEEDEDEGEDDEPEEQEQPEFGTDDEGASGVGCPIEIDFEDLKDTDSALEEAIRGMLSKAFDTTTQTHFTRDFDTVKPYEAPAHQDVSAMETRVKQVAGALQKELQRIMVARSQSYFTPGFRSGRLNGPSLHRLQAHDDRIFKRRHVAETNKVAVSLICDLSGSMGGSKVQTALMAAWAFSEVLDRLKIANEVCGFTTGTYPFEYYDPAYDQFQKEVEAFYDATGIPHGSVRITPLWQPIFKGYQERFTQEVKRRLAHMYAHQEKMRSNNDAVAIEYAGERLRRRTETRKIMIVFSDGQPADAVTQSVLNNSVRTNVETLEKLGVETIGIGIQDSSVRHFYKRWHRIDKVEELPRFVINELKGLLTH